MNISTGPGESNLRRRLDHFVGREQHLFTFVDHINGTSHHKGPIHFWSEGGNGKTLLLDYMRLRLSFLFDFDNWDYLRHLPPEDCVSQVAASENGSPVPSIRIDFGTTLIDRFQILMKIRRDCDRLNVAAPLFDLASIRYLQTLGILGENRIRDSVAEGVANFATGVTATLLGGPASVVAGTLLGSVQHYLAGHVSSYLSSRSIVREDIQQILDLDPQTELLDFLPEYLAQDISVNVGPTAHIQSMAFFLDRLDALRSETVSQGDLVYFQKDEWLRRFVSRLDFRSGITVVMTGRERLRWSDALTYPIFNVASLRLGELTTSQANQYLTNLGISDESQRSSVLGLAKVDEKGYHPLSLALAVDSVMTWMTDHDIFDSKIFEIDPDDNRRVRLVFETFLASAAPETRNAVKALCACRSFDFDIFRYLGEQLQFQATIAAYELVLKYSFIHDIDSTSYQVHDVLRRVSQQLDGDHATLAHQVMISYYDSLLESNLRDDPSLSQLVPLLIEKLFHENQFDWRLGFEQWFQIFDGAEIRSRRSLCEGLFTLHDSLKIEGDRERGMAATMMARFSVRMGRLSLAEEHCKSAIDIFDAILSDTPKVANILNDKANCLLLLSNIATDRGDVESRQIYLEIARGLFLQAARIEPERPGYWSNVANAWSESAGTYALQQLWSDAADCYRKAERILTKALQIGESRVELLNGLGITRMKRAKCYEQVGEANRALDLLWRARLALEEVVEIASPMAIYFNNLGSCIQAMALLQSKHGQLVRARRSYMNAIDTSQMALTLSPEYLIALDNLAEYCHELAYILWYYNKYPHSLRKAFRMLLRGQRAAASAVSGGSVDPRYGATLEKIEARLDQLIQEISKEDHKYLLRATALRIRNHGN